MTTFFHLVYTIISRPNIDLLTTKPIFVVAFYPDNDSPCPPLRIRQLISKIMLGTPQNAPRRLLCAKA